MAKIAIILQAGPGSHESHARMFHSMVYSKELHEKGHEVRLIFRRRFHRVAGQVVRSPGLGGIARAIYRIRNGLVRRPPGLARTAHRESRVSAL